MKEPTQETNSASGRVSPVRQGASPLRQGTSPLRQGESRKQKVRSRDRSTDHSEQSVFSSEGPKSQVSQSSLTFDIHEFHLNETNPEKIRASWFLQLLLVLNFFYCIVEIFVALMSHSLVMLTDGFHNFADVIMLMMTLAVHMNQDREHPALPFGYKRLEVIGGLINTVLMVALAFYILLGAIPLIIYEPDQVTADKRYLTIAILSVFLNVLGVICFASYGLHHHHGGINDRHTCPGHNHVHQAEHWNAPEKDAHDTTKKQSETDKLLDAENGHSHSHNHSHNHADSLCHEQQHSQYGSLKGEEEALDENRESLTKTSTNFNLWAVFIHSLSDCVFSSAVVALGFIVYFKGDEKWTEYADPTISICMSFVILYLSWPLLRDASIILMEGSPPNVDKEHLRLKIQKIKGVLDATKVAVVQLNVDSSFASIKAVVDGSRPNYKISMKIKNICKQFGIEDVTVELDDTPQYG